ncbi:restriction endonuclease subunit S [Vibrio harveyi]|uniref:restriction endonuclease subunit S n=1 Tax=Vibrio harveyi TaxID=669 RepID=UPI0025AFAB7D|nr:restriction endonuclease subunit S [Vibrio harveyi]WJT10650.1 restriction endonuclease subunit S [Vibrio harveyi]
MVKLGSVARLINGRAYKKNELLQEGKYKVLRVGNFFSNRGWYWSDLELPQDKYCDDGDLLYAWSASFYPQIWDGGQVIYHYHIWKLELDEERVDKKYLFHALKYDVEKIKLEQGTGSTMIHVTKAAMEDRQIPLPPLDEQKRIAAMLDKADAIRQKRKQAIALADEFLRSVFLDMFGNDLVRPSERITLGEVTILDAKMVDPREEKYLDLLHIGPDRIEKRSGKLLPALTAREEMLISKKFLFDEEYVLYSKIRPYLRKVAIPDFSALCSADMYPVKPVKDKVTREFIWMLLLSDLFDNYVGSLPDRANIPKLNKKELAAFEFSLPHFEKIKKFSDVVKKINYKKVKMEESFSLATCSFNALSQKAFSGQL